jgi:hypothetical protein
MEYSLTSLFIEIIIEACLAKARDRKHKTQNSLDKNNIKSQTMGDPIFIS